jgi:hypothetical protein
MLLVADMWQLFLFDRTYAVAGLWAIPAQGAQKGTFALPDLEVTSAARQGSCRMTVALNGAANRSARGA